MTRHPKGTKIHFAGGRARSGMSAPAAETGFDAEAWRCLIAEQKALIAHAAGVDPSRVSIRLGH